jgi:ricin-type beta-trefoil lectin protein
VRKLWMRAALSALAVLALTPALPAAAEPAPRTTLPPGATQAGAVPLPAREPSVLAVSRRDELLGAGWRRSADRLWTVSGDSDGLHLLLAEAKTGYSWRTVATLAAPGVETDQWIGNACLTGSGNRAVVVYAPRSFTNKEKLAGRGGFTAVVDLTSGVVRPLPIRTSLAYFNPGCGSGETAALTQEGQEDLGKTGVSLVDAATGRVGARTELDGQVTSATPLAGGFVVADRLGLLKVAKGVRTRIVAGTGGVPFSVHADGAGGVVFADLDGDTQRVFRAAGHSVSMLATGPRGRIALAAGSGGHVFITGAATVASLPSVVSALPAPATDRVSTRGEAVLTSELNAAATAGSAVYLHAMSTRTRRDFGFTVDPATATAAPLTAAVPYSPPVDPDRTCSVPRNDPATQVYQPRPKEVEWAVDNAIRGGLLDQRPANWMGNGLSAYTPQFEFPPIALAGGGQVPAQILLGILGQESNLWQAARFAYPGETANPLIGNYYGTDIYNGTADDDWDIRWDQADCGYGVAQVTDGMRRFGHTKPGETALPLAEQYMIATDFLANISQGLRILQSKWNQLQAAGIHANNNNPARIENWFFAVWAYNSGFHNQGEAGSNGAWGLGWVNNPANPRYPATRHNFGSDPHDYATPQQWPYEEKVLGFASDPPSGYEAPGAAVPFFRAAWWPGKAGDETVPDSAEQHKLLAFPAKDVFCKAAENNCQYGTVHVPTAPEVVGEPGGPCAHTNTAGQYDLRCWWHTSMIWREGCDTVCGREFIRYDPGVAAPTFSGPSYPPVCTTAGLTHTAQMVDDVPDPVAPVEVSPCRLIGSSFGQFDLAFARDANGLEASKIDLHQQGGGYGAHYWMSHARTDTAEARKLKIDGTWTFNPINGSVLARVRVHIPAHAQANSSTSATPTGPSNVQYVVDTANGPRTVTIDQNSEANKWVDLGVFPFNDQVRVHLSTLQPVANGYGVQKVIWDAAAIEPAYRSQGFSAALVNQGRSDAANLCMMLQGNVATNTAVVQQACTPWNVNYWAFTDWGASPVPGVDYFQIQDWGSGRCLGIQGGSTAAGAPVVEVACDNHDDSQLWAIAPGDTPQNKLEDITNKHSGMRIGPAGSSDQLGAVITQRPVTPLPDGSPDHSQAWLKRMATDS